MTANCCYVAVCRWGGRPKLLLNCQMNKCKKSTFFLNPSHRSTFIPLSILPADTHCTSSVNLVTVLTRILTFWADIIRIGALENRPSHLRVFSGQRIRIGAYNWNAVRDIVRPDSVVRAFRLSGRFVEFEIRIALKFADWRVLVGLWTYYFAVF